MKHINQLDFFDEYKPLPEEDTDTKICYICKELQPLEDFPWDNAEKKWRRKECKECNYKLFRERYRLRKQYPPPKDPNYKCPICSVGSKNSVNKKTVWNLDHCHDTKKFRAYICATCNKGLGMFKDKTTLLNEAIKYLNKHKEGNV